MPRCSWRDLKRANVLPEIPEQEAIAKVLAAVNTAIEQTAALIAKHAADKSGADARPLHARRAPGRQAPSIVPGGAGSSISCRHLARYRKTGRLERLRLALPVRLGATTIGPFGSNLVASDYRSEGVPVVFVRDVKEGTFEWNSEIYITPKKAFTLSSHTVRPGDIVATKMGLPPCVTCSYPAWMAPGVITADIIRLRPDLSYVDVRWLSAVLNSEVVKRQVQAITAGVTRPKITLKDFRTLRIPCPRLPEQSAIGDRLETIDRLADTDFERLNKLRPRSSV